MPQSLAAIYLHLIWSTKDRMPLLVPAVRPRLFEYMGVIFRDLNCPAITMNAVDDHIHVLCRLSRTLEVADLFEEVKGSSSKWHKTSDGGALRQFAWQSGYGAFSVSASHVDEVIAYIARQEEHHRQRSFQEEFRTLLDRYKIEYDEKYLWD